MATVNIAGLNKAELLAALYNGAGEASGIGLLQARSGRMTRDDAEEIIIKGDDSARMFPQFRDNNKLYFDYVYGKPLKVDISGDEVDVWGYDRDYGVGALARIVESLRK